MNTESTVTEEQPFTYGQTFAHRGIKFCFKIEPDHGYAAWKRRDGYDVIRGPVSAEPKWHERVLLRIGGYRFFYDVAVSKRVAQHIITTSGSSSDSLPAETRADLMVEADFEATRSWFANEPGWVGIHVTALYPNGQENPFLTGSLWRLRADAGQYLNTVARRIADELVNEIARNPLLADPSKAAATPLVDRIQVQVHTVVDGQLSPSKGVIGLDIHSDMPEGLELVGRVKHGDMLRFDGPNLRKLIIWASRRLADEHGISLDDLRDMSDEEV